MTIETRRKIWRHAIWLKNQTRLRQSKYGIRADLDGADLRGVNLCRANLRCANLSGADLYRAKGIMIISSGKCHILSTGKYLIIGCLVMTWDELEIDLGEILKSDPAITPEIIELGKRLIPSLRDWCEVWHGIDTGRKK